MLTNDEQEQFTRFWTEAQASVAGYVRAVVRDPDVTKDVLQQTALVLLRKFREWDPSRSFLPWALGVAKYEILAHRRDSGRSRLVFDETLLDSVTEMWAQVASEISQEQAVLHDCMEKLAPRALETVRLRYFHDLEMQQIGERLGTTAGAVRISLMRIRERLQECVERRLRTEGGTA